VTQASSNPWKSMTTTEDSSGGGWKPISSINPEQQQRSSIQEEQNKTLREIVAQMNQVKNNPISTLVGLENKEEPNSRDELKQSRSNIYPEQQDRSAIQQPQQQSYSNPKQLLQQLQQLQQLQIQQQQHQQLQLQQHLQMQSQLQTQQSLPPQQQPSVLNQSGSSAWKTLSSKDIPKSFIDIQKEEEQQKISRDHESPWGAVKANDPIRRDQETKKPTTQQQLPHNIDQQQQLPPQQQQQLPPQKQQSKRPANQKQQPPPHSGTGNRNNMKHSK